MSTNQSLISMIENKDESGAIALIDSSSDSTICNKQNVPLLCYAIKQGLAKLAKTIIDKDYKTILQTNDNNENALYYIIKYNQKPLWQEMKKALSNNILSAMSQQNKQGRNLLHIAALYDNNEIVECLVDNMPHLLYVEDFSGKWPVEIALEGKNADMVKLLCDKGSLLPRVKKR